MDGSIAIAGKQVVRFATHPSCGGRSGPFKRMSLQVSNDNEGIS